MITEEKKEFYEKATDNILKQVASLNLTPDQQSQAVKLVHVLRESFKDDKIKKATALANSPDNIWDLGYDSAGFCRVSSVLFMYAMENTEDWQLMSMPEGVLDYEHHWLMHKKTGKVLDLTYDQFAFKNQKIPYDKGEKTAPNISFDQNDDEHVFAKLVGFDLTQLVNNRITAKRAKPYAQRYEEFTKAIVKLAKKIHAANKDKINAQYTLPEITLALRNIYKKPVFHEAFVSSKMSDNKWSSGFCAMASILIYELYGGDKVWNMMAVRYNDWLDSNGQPISSVVFLQDKTTGINFGTTGEHFYPLTIPYEIGKPLDIGRLRTPNKDEFKRVLLHELSLNTKD